jgi:hypothetical protein
MQTYIDERPKGCENKNQLSEIKLRNYNIILPTI